MGKRVLTKLFKIVYALSFISLFYFLGCQDDENLLNTNYVEQLAGKWTETFNWVSSNSINLSENSEYTGSIEKTSTIIFFENEFSVKILPPHKIIIINGDSVWTDYNKDTLYTGTYKVNGDTLTFFPVGESNPQHFGFSMGNNIMKISQMPERIDDSTSVLKLSEFLWGNCLNKHSGTFRKTE